MTQLLARLRARVTYANITATVALFVALGGTSYAALTLPRNSVGSAQIRKNAVSASEIRARAVGSSEIRDRAIRLSDIAASARTSLRGAQGPAGPAGPKGDAATTYRAAVDSGGGRALGNARAVSHQGGTNEYTVEFPGDVDGVNIGQCIYSVTLAAVQNGPTLEQPPAGRATTAAVNATSVLVKTYDAAGTAAPEPFHLIVAC
jgi:hypothetical protein